jgi:hypothetical protein
MAQGAVNNNNSSAMDTPPWICGACTYKHEEPTELTLKRCAMCDSPRAAAVRHEPDTTAASDSEEEEEDDDNDDAYDAFDEPSDPSAPDDGDRAEKRKRAQEEHAFEEQESALAKQFAGNSACVENKAACVSQPEHACLLTEAGRGWRLP